VRGFDRGVSTGGQGGSATATFAVRFVPAIVTSAVAHKGGGARAAIVVRVGPTATVEVEESVSAGWVAELMTELERLACS
jgi:hypothetical protein